MRDWRDDTATADLQALPRSLHSGITLYIDKGVLPGDFLQALISGDLFEAIQRADAENALHIVEIARWFWAHAPALCFGKPAHMRRWCAHGGWEGLTQQGTADTVPVEER